MTHRAKCLGCEELPHHMMGEHPWVAIVEEHGEFVARPVCARCHAHPGERPRRIKGHFFPVSQARHAAAAANKRSNTLGA